MLHDFNASHQWTTTPSSAAALSPIPASTTIGGVQAPPPRREPPGPDRLHGTPGAKPVSALIRAKRA
ncbi:hypothetical protein CPLU01_04233 [Colletotrichum plurivorum]|uniref:Uncharacterized protein n=1 Tax=Colletotrichum plurivorum TaxID=2175906 RepID=A0A8H6KQ08_9PEZI|nr:hypothetical protein CPLU01_04233 [Colletotrichum plurivorum]